MKVIFYVVVLLASIWGYRHYSQQKRYLLKAGDVAPDFELIDQHGAVIKKSQFQNQWLVLYFYPKDDTPGCTKEACQFRDDKHQLEALGAHVVGISVDDAASHQAFANKYNLPFSLLVDKDGAVAKKYGALTQVGPIEMAKRYTFLINPQGDIAKAYYSVKVSKHSQQIVDDLTQFNQAT